MFEGGLMVLYNNMKAYGIRSKFTYNYIDNTKNKNELNWWELELGRVKSKKTARQKANRFDFTPYFDGDCVGSLSAYTNNTDFLKYV